MTVVAFRSQPERITRENLLGRKTTNAIHMDSSREAIWTFGVEGIPRLGVVDVYTRKTRMSVRQWLVDGKRVRDLDAALAVLNGEVPLEDVEAIMREAKPTDNLHTVAMWASVLCLRCRACEHRAALTQQHIPIQRGNMTAINSLKLKCSACGSNDIERLIPPTVGAAADWVKEAPKKPKPEDGQSALPL
jgi:hypothetical protein